MNDTSTVRELQPPAGLLCDVDGLFEWETMVGGVLDNPCHISPAHEFSDHVRLACLLAKIEHCDDVRVGAEPPHGLGFSGDSGAGHLVQALGLDEREGHFPIQQGVLGQVDLLLAALTEETFHFIAGVGKGGGLIV